MARKEEEPIVEIVRKEAHDAGVLDQTRSNIREGHIEQVTRNIKKSFERLRGEK